MAKVGVEFMPSSRQALIFQGADCFGPCFLMDLDFEELRKESAPHMHNSTMDPYYISSLIEDSEPYPKIRAGLAMLAQMSEIVHGIIMCCDDMLSLDIREELAKDILVKEVTDERVFEHVSKFFLGKNREKIAIMPETIVSLIHPSIRCIIEEAKQR